MYRNKLLAQFQTAVLVAAWVTAWPVSAMQVDPATGFAGLLLEPAKLLTTRDLLTHNGDVIRFPHAVSGRLQLVFFGYTHCPDVCPATLLKVKALKHDLGAIADELDFYLVTVDPARDPPPQLKRFVAYYDPALTGITGDPHAVQELQNDFGVLTRKFQGRSALTYTMEHSVFLYLLDQQGRLRLMFPASTTVAAMRHDISRLLNEEKAKAKVVEAGDK